MKRSLGFYVIMVMMIFCLIGSSLGEEDLLQSGNENTIATSGVDVIVVLDMSGSMDDPRSSTLNDKNGYRLDATAVLIGMLDTRSRIGIVPFGGTINEKDVQDLSKLSDSNGRDQLIKYVYSLKNISYGTNYGSALMRALYMLNSREDTANSPMIVLLTDGYNTISYPEHQNKANIDRSYRWDGNQIIGGNQEGFDTNGANKVTLEAKNCAQTLGIPIYTVSLNVSPDNRSGGVSLRDIADDTGGKVFHAQPEEAKKMPQYFAEILADRIGSSVENNLEPILKGDHYEVMIPVLNKSILELNVILPIAKDEKNSNSNLSGIRRDTIKVYDQYDAELTKTDGVDRWYSGIPKTGSFAIIKIMNPDTVSHGTKWRIHFESDNDPGTIPFNFLYNYNIKLDASVDSPNALYKADVLKLHGFFVTQDGQKVDDETLYEDRSNDEDFGKYEWSTIHSSWRLFYANPDGSLGHAVAESQMMENRMAQKDFYTEINLAPYELKAGNYFISIFAEGAGLKRSMYLPITLLNHTPSAASFEADPITVNKREEAGREHKNDSWTVSGTSGKLKINGGQVFNVNEIITDDDSTDQNALHGSFALQSASDQNAAELVLNADGTIDVKTFADGTNGIKTGIAEYTLEYSDGTTEGKGSVPIAVDIISDDEALKRQYDPEITVSGDQDHLSGSEQSYESKKNTDLTITLKLKDKNNSSYARDNIMKGLYSDLRIQNQDENDIKVEAVNQGEPQGGAFVWTVNTGNTEAEWTAKIRLGTYDIAPIVIRIPNNAEPKASPAAANSLLNYKGEKVPAFLRSIVGKDTPKDDPSIQVKVGELFSDDDNDKPTFGDPVYMNEGNQNIEIEKSAIKLVLSDGSDSEPMAPAYRVEVNGEPTALFRYTATGKVKITATDGDGKTSDYTLTVQIVDLYNKMLTWIIIILIAIAILVILILIIHQIRKPVFPKLELTIREEPSLYETGREMLSPVKTPTNANAVGIDSDIAAKHGLALEFLQNIIIKPIRSRMAVGLICKKDMSGQEALLDDVRLKAKKQYVWNVGQELSIRSEHGDGMVVIKLESPTETGEDDPMEDFGGNSDWDEVTAGDMKNQTGRKHGKKVAKKQAPVQEETPVGDKDDFEF